MKARGIKHQKFSLWLEINVPGQGLVGLDVTRFSAQFAVNSIPQATCSIALGAYVGNPALLSNLHFILNKISYRAPAVIYMAVSEGYSSIPPGIVVNKDLNFDGKAFVVFEGFTSGAGYKRAGESVEYVISLEHWLSDLNNSTALSPDLVPGTPFNMLFPSINQDSTLRTVADGFIDPSLKGFGELVATQDLGAAILKWFKAMTELNPVGADSQNVLGINDIPDLEGAFTSKKNDAAQAALAKFITAGGYRHVKLKLQEKQTNQDIIDNIQNVFYEKNLKSFDGSTFWDNLINFSSLFMYNIVPGITNAWLAPKLANYRVPWKTIFSTEINSYDISTGMPRFISGVVLKGRDGENTGLLNIGNDGPNNQPASILSYFSLGMYFSQKRFTTPGAVLFQRGPEWLERKMGKEADGALILPLAKQPQDVDLNLAQKAVEKLELGIAFARLVYSNEVLKYRNGSVFGKFRTDIAPGSIVKIETASENAFQGDSFSYPLFAHVDQVSLTVDSLASQAGTSFSISSVRTEFENQDVDLTTDTNPLYDSVWSGTSLHVGG